ncbi:uncharacterized protein [Ptychodera flava]|uniref:uncharacterized protein n=1 Tax=Ptychodera flava TaxID=63121 RepID=UPI00396A337B
MAQSVNICEIDSLNEYPVKGQEMGMLHTQVFITFPQVGRQDVVYYLVALRIEFHIYVILEIISTRRIEISLTLIDIHLPGWSWELGKEIGPGNSRSEQLPDDTPPEFEEDDGCEVSQIIDRDVTDPAFQLIASAHDGESPVQLKYCIGTFSGGCDVIKQRDLGQQGTMVTEVLRSGVPLHFTVTAINDGDGSVALQCEIPTYDTTVPMGRVTPDFRTTSHPGILRASSVITDDSQLILKKEAVGYGFKKFGHQVVNWTEVKFDEGSELVNLPPERESMDYFTAPQNGRLDSRPFETSGERYEYNCAYKCLQYPTYKCLSFNFDYGSSGRCELLEHIVGEGRNVHQT